MEGVSVLGVLTQTFALHLGAFHKPHGAEEGLRPWSRLEHWESRCRRRFGHTSCLLPLCLGKVLHTRGCLPVTSSPERGSCWLHPVGHPLPETVGMVPHSSFGISPARRLGQVAGKGGAHHRGGQTGSG